jgi:hypothetical protein
MLAGDGMDSLLECLVLGVRGSQFSSICYRASGLSICQVKSIPSFGATGLASLIQKVEAPEGDGRSLGSLPGWFGGATRLTSQSVVKSMWQVTLRISLFRWVAPPLHHGVRGALYAMGCMAPQSFAAGRSRSYLHPWAIIDIPSYWGNLP